MKDDFDNNNGEILEFPKKEARQEDSSDISRMRCTECQSINFRILYIGVEGKLLCSSCGAGKEDIKIFIQKITK